MDIQNKTNILIIFLATIVICLVILFRNKQEHFDIYTTYQEALKDCQNKGFKSVDRYPDGDYCSKFHVNPVIGDIYQLPYDKYNSFTPNRDFGINGGNPGYNKNKSYIAMEKSDADGFKGGMIGDGDKCNNYYPIPYDPDGYFLKPNF